jgi:hypothetical protein
MLKTACLALAAALSVATAAQAAPDAAAQAFSRQLVTRLNGGDIPAGWLDPSLQALRQTETGLSASRDLAGDALEYDMLCQCQDTGNRFRLVSTTDRPGGRVAARIAAGEGGRTLYTIVIGRVGAAWRVWDVENTEVPSWRAFMTRHIACLRQHPNDPTGALVERCTGRS